MIFSDGMSVASIKRWAMELMPGLKFTIYTTSCDLNLVSGSQQHHIWGHEIIFIFFSRPVCKCKYICWLNHGHNTVFDWKWYTESLYLMQYLTEPVLDFSWTLLKQDLLIFHYVLFTSDDDTGLNVLMRDVSDDLDLILSYIDAWKFKKICWSCLLAKFLFDHRQRIMYNPLFSNYDVK